MRLLVSVRNGAEAEAALAGGADIIDAKEPAHGALGPVAPSVLATIRAAVGDAAPVSMALGDAGTDDIDRGLAAAEQAGVAFVKIGFAGCGRDMAALPFNVRATPAATILVAYADYEIARAPSPADVIVLGRRAGVRGILLDTFDKAGPGLTTLMEESALRAFVFEARSLGQIVAVAGKLSADDIERVCDTGADIVGVRGAACDGGRAGVVRSERVRALRRQLELARSTAC